MAIWESILKSFQTPRPKSSITMRITLRVVKPLSEASVVPCSVLCVCSLSWHVALATWTPCGATTLTNPVTMYWSLRGYLSFDPNRVLGATPRGPSPRQLTKALQLGGPAGQAPAGRKQGPQTPVIGAGEQESWSVRISRGFFTRDSTSHCKH